MMALMDLRCRNFFTKYFNVSNFVFLQECAVKIANITFCGYASQKIGEVRFAKTPQGTAAAACRGPPATRSEADGAHTPTAAATRAEVSDARPSNSYQHKKGN
jgi:hypothetical protein